MHFVCFCPPSTSQPSILKAPLICTSICWYSVFCYAQNNIVVVDNILPYKMHHSGNQKQWETPCSVLVWG